MLSVTARTNHARAGNDIVPRSKKGLSLIEFVISVIAMMPFLFLLIDVFMIVSAIQLNNAVCAEAARLSSIGDPRLAVRRAQQIVSATVPHCPSPFALRLVNAGSTVDESCIEALLPYGGQVKGNVSVTTEVSVKPLILSWFLGRTQLRVLSKQEFPSTYVLPNCLEQSVSLAQTKSNIGKSLRRPNIVLLP